MDKLVNVSVDHGIFITHILDFRNKDYLFDDFSCENIFTRSEFLFPNYKQIDDNSTVPLNKKDVVPFAPAELQQLVEHDNFNFFNEDELDRVAFFVKLRDENLFDPEKTDAEESFDLETKVEKIRSMLIGYHGYRYAGDFLKMAKEFKYYNEFIKKHLAFKPERITKDSFSDKVIGLLIWDSVNGQGLSIKESSSNYLFKLKKSKRNESKNCEMSDGNGTCDYCISLDSCERNARELYSTANKSIQKGKIVSSRQKNSN